MSKRIFGMGLLCVALLLTGCGKNPASMTTQRVSSFKKQLPKPVALSNAPAAAAASVSTVQPGVRLVNGQPAPAPVTTPVAKTGAMSLKIRTLGTTPVGSLLLNVASQVDPTQVALVPLAMNGTEATWQHEDLLPGGYDLRIEVRDPAGKPVGSGATVAQVVAGELAAVTLDVTVEAPVISNPPVNTEVSSGGESGAAGAEEEPVPSASDTTDAVAGTGGTLGLRIEFQ